ncbi:MAG: hypothetical protein K1X85_04710 [Ignavibacteria bacterium]|nr:hypothetical protein [Ignavibacteria bacterium]
MNDEIRKSIAKAESLVAKLRKTNSRYIVISLAASVLATLLAGLTAFTGPVAGQGPPAWKWTCGIVAVFTATATIFTGLQKQLMITEKLSKATECVGKLRSIDFTLSNSEKDEERKDALSEYKKVLEVYSEYV